MTTYFTADLHLHHKNILWHCDRKSFSDIDDMDRKLIEAWNEEVGNNDRIYCIGDFSWTRDSRTFAHDMHQVKGKTVFIRGNHDDGLQHADYFICRNIKGIKILMRHWPPWSGSIKFPHLYNIPSDVDIILCGHVHNKWIHRIYKIGQKRIPVINVGVDVWGYKPVDLDTVVKEALKYTV